MDNGNYKYGAPLQRHLSPLKLVSRLLGHEMHVQGNVKAVSFTREQVLEIQSSIDLLIEEAARRVGGAAGMTGGVDLIRRRLYRCDLARTDQHPCARHRQRLGNHPPDAGAATGDQRHLAVEFKPGVQRHARSLDVTACKQAIDNIPISMFLLALTCKAQNSGRCQRGIASTT